jgi:hypothetical protein
MKTATVFLASVFAVCGVASLAPKGNAGQPTTSSRTTGVLVAQAGAPSGRGATAGDPAASSATPGTSPTTGSSTKPNASGSGMSTSGGRDDNGDQGRDKMPESSKSVRPANKPDKM